MDDPCVAFFRAIQKMMNTIDAQNREIERLNVEKVELLKSIERLKSNAE